MKTVKCSSVLLLLSLVFTLVTTQVHAQQKENKTSSVTITIDSLAARGLAKETKVRYYYTDKDGKKKYVSNGKTQTMWSMILSRCPECITIAEDYNVNIYQNKRYIKKEKEN